MVAGDSMPAPGLPNIDPPVLGSAEFLKRYDKVAKSKYAWLEPPWHGDCEPGRTAAAVLIPVVDHADGLTVLLTRRSEHLDHHPGQISFPGGRRENGDASPVATAIRETREEIGLDARHIHVLGGMDRIHSNSGFCITPIIALVQPGYRLKIDSFEVDDVFTVPLNFFLQETNYKYRSIVYNEKRHAFHELHYQGRRIWGITAGILASFRNMLFSDINNHF